MSAQGKSSKKVRVRSIMTLLMIISLTWYAKQGQNNPFRDMRVIKIKTMQGYTSLVSYTKKRDDIKNYIILPLKQQAHYSSLKSETLKDITLINNLSNLEIKSYDSIFKEVFNLKDLEELRKTSNSLKGVYFSDAIDISGLIISKIYTNKSDTAIALSIMAEDISIISIDDSHRFINDPATVDLKEKFMIALVKNVTEESAKEIRNILRPEYLLALSDTDQRATIENIVFLSPSDSLKISKNIKGMIRLKDLGS